MTSPDCHPVITTSRERDTSKYNIPFSDPSLDLELYLHGVAEDSSVSDTLHAFHKVMEDEWNFTHNENDTADYFQDKKIHRGKRKRILKREKLSKMDMFLYSGIFEAPSKRKA